MVKHFSPILKDIDIMNLSEDHRTIADDVKRTYEMHKNVVTDVEITSSQVSNLIKSLKRGCSPGVDGICAEHLIYGASDILYNMLSSIYSAALSWGCVPEVCLFVKKQTLNSNEGNKYRPVTLSSTHAKLLEFLMLPEAKIENNQFGFRENRGTSLGCVLLNDIVKYFNHNGSPMYICSLDAEKCFDTIWHDALLLKLWGKVSINKWLLLHRWYKHLKASIRWNGEHSKEFSVTKGTRQGSVLSPYLFNIFLNDILCDLKKSVFGARIENCKFESFAYADDITLFSPTVAGLQGLIDICTEYAVKWRFKFGISKSKCMVAGHSLFKAEPHWQLSNNMSMENVDALETLGVVLSNDGTADINVQKRINKCRQAYYSLDNTGMPYPGLPIDIKMYLYKSVCLPTLLFGMEIMFLSDKLIKKLESFQGSLMKRSRLE